MESQYIDNKGLIDAETRIIDMKKLVFFNTKGGTGKTTLCYNYGWYLALKRQKRVLFLDFDPQINLVKSFPDVPAQALEQTIEKMVVQYTRKHPIDLKDYLLRVNPLSTSCRPRTTYRSSTST